MTSYKHAVSCMAALAAVMLVTLLISSVQELEQLTKSHIE
jgi:hypothetical protein